jgi:hypothetical protein
MGKVTIKTEISYSQITVFQYGMDQPFNDWTDIHVEQGFSWRPGSVAFGTLTDGGSCEIQISVADSFEVNPNAIRVITVPFEVGTEGIELDSTEPFAIQIQSGVYELVFSAIPKLGDDEEDIYEFCFVRTQTPQARILVADEGLTPPSELVMEASAAV